MAIGYLGTIFAGIKDPYHTFKQRHIGTGLSDKDRLIVRVINYILLDKGQLSPKVFN